MERGGRLAGARDWLGRAIDWERLRTPENDWERLGSAPTRLRDYGTTRRRDDETAGQRDNGTTGRRDCGTTRLRDSETARRRDDETAGQRDNGTTGRRDYGTAGRRDNGTTGPRDHGTTGRRDHGTTRLRDCGTTRLRDDGTTGPRDHGTTRLRDSETARPMKNTGVLRRSQSFSVVCGSAEPCEAAWRESGADVVHRKREYHGIVLKRTARGTLLFGMCRRCAAITSSYHAKLRQGYLLSFAHESLSVTVRLNTRWSAVESVSGQK